jgi:8-oxo-dGTP pyrophosphatase MutT (NUDIX family)
VGGIEINSAYGVAADFHSCAVRYQGRRVAAAVREAIEEAGFSVVNSADSGADGARRVTLILEGIRRADLIVADIGRQNPNVLYEVGFAHALRKPTILLADLRSDVSVPSDFVGLPYIVYDPTDLGALKERVRAETSFITSRRSVMIGP